MEDSKKVSQETHKAIIAYLNGAVAGTKALQMKPEDGKMLIIAEIEEMFKVQSGESKESSEAPTFSALNAKKAFNKATKMFSGITSSLPFIRVSFTTNQFRRPFEELWRGSNTGFRHYHFC